MHGSKEGGGAPPPWNLYSYLMYVLSYLHNVRGPEVTRKNDTKLTKSDPPTLDNADLCKL